MHKVAEYLKPIAISLLVSYLAYFASSTPAWGDESDLGKTNTGLKSEEYLNSDKSADLFRSRFPVDSSNNKDLSVLESCPNQSDLTQTTNSQPIVSNRFNSGDSVKFNDSKITSSNVLLKADKVPENSEKITVLEGNVTMLTDKSILHADKLINNNESRTLVATGNVSVETEDSLLRANKFQSDQNSEESKLSEVKFHFFGNNGNGDAESITMDKNKVATLNNLTFTTCPTGNKSWQFSANELELDPESGRGEAWGMWLKLKNIPVFYFPYLNFPIDDQRKSGFLPPVVSDGDRNGLDISLPVYWNIAENFDATLKARSIQNRGNQLGAEFRYLSNNTMNQMSFEWLRDDRFARNLLTLEPDLSEGLYGLTEDRWAISLKNTSHFNEYWSASLDAGKVSDRDYFRDLGSELISRQATNSESQILSRGDVTYQDDIWIISFLAESTQSLVGDEPYRLVPSLITSADYYDADIGLRWQFESDLSRFTHSDKSLVHGARVNLLPSVSFPQRNTYAWMTPKLGYQISHYEQKVGVNGDEVEIDRNMPIFSLDSGIYLDRAMQWNESMYTHSLEPRLFYAYIPFREQNNIPVYDSRMPDFSFSQLWRANRFVGNDRIGDTNHLAVSLTNRFVEDKTGEQILEMTFGKKLYFEDREVSLGESINLNNHQRSPWLAEINYQPNSRLTMTGFIEWSDEPSLLKANRGTILARSQINFEPMKDHIVNLSHRVRNKNEYSNEELDLSFAWPINDEWRLVGRWYNDLQKRRTSETLFGFEYESCCWAISIVSRRYLDVRLDAMGEPVFGSTIEGRDEQFNSGVYMQFVFKGLGSPGQKSVSKLLANSIKGYKSRF